jgi:hypothetical protein
MWPVRVFVLVFGDEEEEEVEEEEERRVMALSILDWLDEEKYSGRSVVVVVPRRRCPRSVHNRSERNKGF